MSTSNRRTIIICIGNELVADDAVGFEIYNNLKKRLICNSARLEFCGVGGIDILPLLENETDMIVVDAVQLGSKPGTVHIIPWEELPRETSAISAHGLGLRETIEIGSLLYPQQMPERVTLVGVEGRCFNRTRDYMTAEVQEAVAAAVIKIEELVARGQ